MWTSTLEVSLLAR